MNSEVNKKFQDILKERFSKEMPRIIKEIKIYEKNLKNNTLNNEPKVAPQFNR